MSFSYKTFTRLKKFVYWKYALILFIFRQFRTINYDNTS